MVTVFVVLVIALWKFWVFIIFGGISYENWWSTNLCEDNPFVFDNKFTLTR